MIRKLAVSEEECNEKAISDLVKCCNGDAACGFCGGGGSNAGRAAKKSDASRQADTGSGAAGGNGDSEAGIDGEFSGNGVEEQIPDAGAVYREGEFFLADTDLYSATVSGYLAEEDGFSVKLKIENKTESEYRYYLYEVIVNRGLVEYEITDGAGNNIDDLKAGPGEKLEAGSRIPAAEFEKYNISVVDELRFSFVGVPAGEDDDDYPTDDLEEPVDDLDESADDIEEPADPEEADAGLTAELEATETEDGFFPEEFCIYPTGKEEKEIIPVLTGTKDEYEWLCPNDQYAFGIRKSLDDQTADSKGVVRYYLENESDTDLGFALEKITVNGMPMFYAKTYTLYSDNGDILIPATSLEAFGIDRVDELQFVVHGESVDDREAFWDAIDSGDYFENKDEEVYDTVTVHPTGMTVYF